MSSLRPVFLRSSRYRRIDGDPYFASLETRILKRPETFMALLYAGYVAQLSHSPYETMASVSAGFIIGQLGSAFQRAAMRIRYDSFSNEKAINTAPQDNINPTSETDYANAKSENHERKLNVAFYAASEAMMLFVPYNMGPELGAALRTTFTGLGMVTTMATTRQMEIIYNLNQIIARRWTIEPAKPKHENEFKEEETDAWFASFSCYVI